MPSEFEFIEKIRSRLARRTAGELFLKTGIGDDCAVMAHDSKTDLVITTDMLVEDIDFRTEWSCPEFIGHKALAVSLSDIAAMGAKPLWSMLSIGVPQKIWKTDFAERFFDGYLRLADEFNVRLIGGDVSKTPDKIVVDSIAAGSVRKGKAVLRSTAQPGDLLFVTGSLGAAAGGLSLLQNGLLYDPAEGESERGRLLLRQLKPFPQVSAAEFLSQSVAGSMIDISDGLSSDLAHLCRASKTGAKLYAEKIPIDKDLQELGISAGKNLDLALNGGEDFELLFTVNPKKYVSVKKTFPEMNFSMIGEITSNVGVIELVSKEESVLLQPGGFRHF